MEADEMLKENNGKNADDIDSYAVIKDEHTSVCRSNQSNGSILRAEENLHGSGSGSQNDVTCRNRIEGVEVDGNTISETQRKSESTLVDNLNPQEENDCSGRLGSSMDSSARDISNPQKENTCGRVQGSMGPSIPGLLETMLSVKGSADAPKQQACAETHLKLANKAHDDSVLEEARIIEERLWKITAAARVCHQIASTSRLRFEEQNLECKQKKVAHTLAKAITNFWHSAQKTSKEVELQCPRKDFSRAVQEYAVRFLKYNNSLVPLRLAEVPATPDRENLVYMVPPGAMETYRKSIESHLAQVEKTGVSIQEEVETSIYDDAADNAYAEDEGETSVVPRMSRDGSLIMIFKMSRGITQKGDWTVISLSLMEAAVPAGQPGSGSPWSLFEDQALVVLVHDMGPNWELVSDAINSSLQFKCIYRNPKECKQRHKILMDETADGADSAEDSGSSQPYPSTLPGIPKAILYIYYFFLNIKFLLFTSVNENLTLGSARQLFRQLQGPMEEDMIKTHFEKIIVISQKLHYRRTKNDNQDQKPIQLHNSHTVALSQVYPNNLNGGAPLTPLDLCDTTALSPDVLSLGYQGSHASGLAISNQTSVASVLPSSGANSSLQGSSNMVPGNNFSSPSGAPTASFRDGRYAVPSMAPMPSPVNMHSGANSGQGNSILRPRDALNMMRPVQDPEHQRQMVVPELQMQMSATEMPESTIDKTTVVDISSSGAQWRAPDNSVQLATTRTPPLTNATGTEPMPTVSQGQGQGQGQGQSSGILPPHRHSGGIEWKHQQSQLQPSSTAPAPPPPQLPQQQLQQQTQHLQAGTSSLYIRPTNSRPE
ncbi:helicase/SANT-associated, DNA binding protein [Actinidia rufa]|uniref:Helicase/SANT-associated, DNA binding protein n=1 Tax=Actinidia rufa TaxID=165716 RepID=A0A7J0H4B9_9ERIC|nr:helicase/SANT-associated, DNA binding protein [Actinidia rufa]